MRTVDANAEDRVGSSLERLARLLARQAAAEYLYAAPPVVDGVEPGKAADERTTRRDLR